MIEVSVLLPVYNGALYLEQTLNSLRCQTFSSFEVLCIDDCSTDNSATIIHDFANLDHRIRYLKTNKNLGTAPKSVNYAIEEANGKRYVYSSQDDFFSPDWLEILHSRAIETRADAVIPDVEMYYEKRKSNRKIIGYKGDRSAILTGRQAFVASLDWTISGNALWPIKFLKEGGLDTFNSFADEYSARRFFLKCNKVAFCNGVFYYRQDNCNAITKKPSPQRLEEVKTGIQVYYLIIRNGFGSSVHGMYATHVLRMLIRSQALIYRNPFLKPEESKIIQSWKRLRDCSTFQNSLTDGVKLKLINSPLYSVKIMLCARSLFWFRLHAYLSSYVSSIKSAIKSLFN